MSIARYDWNFSSMDDGPTGEYVLYADHVAAIAEAERLHLTHYEDGIKAERDRIRQAVEALGQQHPKWDALSTHYEDCWKHHSECALTIVLSIIDGEGK